MRKSIWAWSFIVTVLLQVLPVKQAIASPSNEKHGIKADISTFEATACVGGRGDIDDDEF